MRISPKSSYPWVPGPIRPRHEPPTLDEAIFAARGLTCRTDEQVEIAASLIGAPAEEIRERLHSLPPEEPVSRPKPETFRQVPEQRRFVVERRRPAGEFRARSPSAR
jgi:hypothetical protein